MRIIPAIDIIDGKCVRLSKGDYASSKVYNEDPLEVAKAFEAGGIKYLHLVDLDGARIGSIINHAVLEKIATHTKLIIDFGGGIQSPADIEIAFESGAGQLCLGSIAVKAPKQFLSWLEEYGSEKIILSADAKNRMIATNGWLEASALNVIDFIKNYEAKGIEMVMCTDIAKDGMLQGPSADLYQDILQATNVKLIASGGISSIKNVEVVSALGCEGVVIGKAIYENRISLKELSAYA
ncbi:MAG: 1-(5-phosphoribosyl)-5-[(5-phosphoribosylamino)methylideneamino]imidazole-4-carboxamide isomerase [Ferruginibacter sp.]